MYGKSNFPVELYAINMEKYTLDQVYDSTNLLSELINLEPIVKRPTMSEVEQAEKELGCKLPPSFIRYYQEAQWHIRWNLNIHLCSVIPLFDGQPSIVESNKLLRNKNEVAFLLPNFLIVFDMDAAIDDDYSCFDMRNSDENGDYPIVYWSSEEPDYILSTDNETGKILEIDDLKIIAPDFP